MGMGKYRGIRHRVRRGWAPPQQRQAGSAYSKDHPEYQQEGQHPLTGQRAANFRRDLEAT